MKAREILNAYYDSRLLLQEHYIITTEALASLRQAVLEGLPRDIYYDDIKEKIDFTDILEGVGYTNGFNHSLAQVRKAVEEVFK